MAENLITTSKSKFQTSEKKSKPAFLFNLGDAWHVSRMTGIPRVAFNLARELINQNLPVRFVIWDEKQKKYFEIERSQVLDKIRSFASYKTIESRSQQGLYRLLKSFAKKILPTFMVDFLKDAKTKFNSQKTHRKTVNWINGEDVTMLIPSPIFSRKEISFLCELVNCHGIKLVLIVYDLTPITTPEYSAVAGVFVNFLTLVKNSYKISCISEATRKKVIQYFEMVEQDKRPTIATHYLAVSFPDNRDSSKISNDQPPIWEKYGINKQIPLFLCVGTIEPRKNHLNLLTACKILSDWGLEFQLLICGAKGWFFEHIIEEYEKMRKNYPVLMLNNVDEKELVTLYKISYATVYVPFEEGFGLPIIESLYFAKPCITSNCSSMKEIALKVKGCLLVDPASSESIALAMKRLLTDKKLYNQKIREAQDFKWKSWKDYALEIYKFAIG
ncbi:MAG: glycosyltransferase family 4 protein [Patescibacteria group bacterium]|nr:glycosyltransferase family 4 protein [Patescibacteria group bacterium]